MVHIRLSGQSTMCKTHTCYWLIQSSKSRNNKNHEGRVVCTSSGHWTKILLRGPFNLWNCPVCNKWDYVLLMETEAFISQSDTFQSLQLSLKPLHTVTCSELWSGNKTNRPVRSLSSMYGRCIDLRALLLHCTKQRGTHYTIQLGAILIHLSLWKRTVCLKGLVSMLTVTSITHYPAENKATRFPPSTEWLCNVALWCKQRWHAPLC